MPKETKITMSEFKTVVESIDSKLQTVVENVQQLCSELVTEFRSVKEPIAMLHDGQTALRIGQSKLRADVDDIRFDFVELKSDMSKVKSDVAEIKQNIITRDEFVNLVGKLESQVS